ncbi:MAG: DUF3526 domain-containing protein [Pseudomonadota bacterium]
MIKSLIRLDIVLLSRSRGFWFLMFLLICAACLALISGLDWRSRYLHAADAARDMVSEDRALLVDIYDGIASGDVTPSDIDDPASQGPFVPDPRDPYVGGFYHSQLVDLPAGPLLGLATGTTELRATHHVIKSVPLASLMRIGEPAERVNPAALAAGRFDLLAFIMYLCPLALTVLLFDAIGRERETGVAPLLAALGPAQRELLIARGLTRGGAVLGAALFASVVGLVLVNALLTPAALLWIFGVTAYLLFWTALLLWVASTGLSLIGSAAIGVSLWLALLLLSPGMVERTLRPSGLLEPRALAEAEVRTVIRKASENDAARAAAKQYVAKTYWNMDFSAAPACANREVILSEYVERRLSDETYSAAMLTGAAREAVYEARLDRWGWLSPPLAFRRSMESIAGVDPARQRAFEAQVIDFHAIWRNRVTDALFTCSKLDREAFDTAPSFQWRAPEDASRGWSGFVLALLLGGALASAALLPKRPLLR